MGFRMNDSDQILFVEKYRPKTVEECILPVEMKKTFQEYVDRKEIPNLILAGSSGVGKTSLARAMCEEIGCDYIMINGSDESGIDTLRTKIKGFASSVSLMGGRKVIIIDEADYLAPNSTQPAFRGVIEEFSNNCSFVFTCNYKNRIIDPIHSRCSVIDFKLKANQKAKMATQFMKRVIDILNIEKIEYDQSVVAELISKYFPDYRRTLNELQRYSVSGKIDVGILSIIKDANLGELVSKLKDKDFNSVRKWISLNNDNEASIIFRQIYDNLYEILKPETIPLVVVLIGKYQYQAAFVADQEINMMAFLTELMIDAEFK
jgi:DNA polymerase III delta prime subunit